MSWKELEEIHQQTLNKFDKLISELEALKCQYQEVWNPMKEKHGKKNNGTNG